MLATDTIALLEAATYTGLLVWVSITLVLTAVYCIEVLAAVFLPKRQIQCSEARVPMVVLIPAHNEEAGLADTLKASQKGLYPGDRILVVADNCSDDTAAVAFRNGAEVIERTDPDRRGKGYALDFGVRHLETNPPNCVVILDADCVPEASALDRIRRVALHRDRPAQARYLMTESQDNIAQKVSVFMFRLKNWIRPLGGFNLGGPSLLTGSGMAFPWNVLARANLAHGHLVEDMKLGFDLASAGKSPIFCNEAIILSPLPQSLDGATTQRSRWVRGHLSLMRTALKRLPRLIAMRKFSAVALALSILVPPLTILVFLQGVAVVSALIVTALLKLPFFPLGLALGAMVAFLITTLAAWWKYGRDLIPVRDLLGLVAHLLVRFAKYPMAVFKPKRSGWARTERDTDRSHK
ncbi:glycosyltransferase family 2 protein [Labrenzia sp. PHM005]|uniref:glycosyltransferase family 2 protein n=1 Tax=Labrenzia sp. PHM005 TaxID=2590016 RepID=UPI00114044AD|nr:glycosyltransferase family 2 protein [Labrenzia sp. PHM005]QDG74814.1 glycosyltransferase [Labrenzia sp. PHM005]